MSVVPPLLQVDTNIQSCGFRTRNFMFRSVGQGAKTTTSVNNELLISWSAITNTKEFEQTLKK
jgi:hypothetical protein